MALNGAAAIRYYETLGRNIFANCLGTVWDAYGQPVTLGPQPGRSFATATDSYNYTRYRHPGDWNPPPGVPVWFGASPTRTDANKDAGDVGVSVGGGKAWFTDSDRGNTYPGIMTLQARAAEISRPYLGWSEDFGGNLIIFTQTTEAGRLTLTAAQKNRRKDDTMTHLAYIPKGGPKGQTLFIQYGPNFYLEFTGQAAANALITQIGGASMPVSLSFANAVKAAVNASAKGEVK